jgi:acylphosphatase
MTALLLAITGHVQGVGYRDWMTAQARRRGVSGWVRNRADGTVEALVHGEADAIADLVRICRRGPPLAAVIGIAETPADPPATPGFRRLPTA